MPSYSKYCISIQIITQGQAASVCVLNFNLLSSALVFNFIKFFLRKSHGLGQFQYLQFRSLIYVLLQFYLLCFYYGAAMLKHLYVRAVVKIKNSSSSSYCFAEVVTLIVWVFHSLEWICSSFMWQLPSFSFYFFFFFS